VIAVKETYGGKEKRPKDRKGTGFIMPTREGRSPSGNSGDLQEFQV